jgi:VWFA-related protein
VVRASLAQAAIVRPVFVPLLMALAITIAIQAQDKLANRPGANRVRVDVYASRDGQSVEDLNRDELELLEDGVPQAIDAFERVAIGDGGAPTPRARVFVVFLDTLNTDIETSSNLRLPVIRFLDRVIGPDDIVALMTPEMAAGEVTFGRKGIVISNIMQGEWSWARHGRLERQDPKEALYDACYPESPRGPRGPAAEMKARRREKLTLNALNELVAYLDDMREGRKAVLTISDGWQLFKPERALVTSSLGKGDDGMVERLLRRPPPPKKGGTEGGGPKDVNRVECDADREALAGLDHTLALQSLSEAANRGNISFYPLYPRGLDSSAATASPSRAKDRDRDGGTPAAHQDSLRFLADNTDGLAVLNSAAVEASIPRIVGDVSSYYLIGYTSSNTKLDGRFRAITIRVKRDGVKVRSRRGYRGPTADDLVSGGAGSGARTNESVVAAHAAVASVNTRAPFKIRASSWVQPDESGGATGSFWIVGELDFQTRRQLAWTAGAQARVVVLAADGTEVLSSAVGVKPSDGPLAIRVPDSGGIPPGEYAVRVELRSEADEEQVMTDTARVEVKTGSTLGEAILWRRGPTTGPQYFRTADPRFSRSDRLRLELATTAKGPVTARLLDRNGKALPVPAQISERPDASATFKWIVVDALLAPFAPGEYAVEVTQGDAKQVTGFRITS